MRSDPIFIHASWRAASTYVWAKFRDRPDTYCYFEPLNEHLSTATHDFIDRFLPWSFAHHPPLAAPYLEEFRPLIRPGGGIPGFPSRLTYGHYCAGRGTRLADLESYLNDLARLARQRGRRPVYGFVRTDLRVAWFRGHMPGKNIFVRREPRRQFLSMLRQAAKRNPYFLQRGLVILQHNMQAPAFAPLLAAVDVRRLLASSELQDVFAGRMAHEATLRQLYIVFYGMRLLSAPLGEAQSDLVIDIDRLSLEPRYREEIENDVQELVGMAISFGDCNVERYDANVGWSHAFFDALEREAEQIEIRIP
jgi:hypothetical protein